MSAGAELGVGSPPSGGGPNSKIGNVTTIVRNLNSVWPRVAAAWDDGDRAWRSAVIHSQTVFSAVSVSLGGGKDPKLFSDGGDVTKLRYNDVQDEWVQVVQFLMADAMSGLADVCPFSTPQCREHCLGHTSGRLQMSNAQTAQLARTTLLVQHPFEYSVLFLEELRLHKRRVSKVGKKLVARPNGDSDVPWERTHLLRNAWLLDLVDMFQDYTKWPVGRRDVPDYYYLAYSVTEDMHPDEVRPGMVVVVDVDARTGGELPETWNGMPVIDGDYEHGDLRILDIERPDAVVLLRKKGSLRKVCGSMNGFVKPVQVTISKIGK